VCLEETFQPLCEHMIFCCGTVCEEGSRLARWQPL
jgi:hypothetical protein